jgi:radical SAM protein with 4Fe4S-binding SPASM domain
MIEACTARSVCTLTSTNGHFIRNLDDALRVVDAGLSGMIIATDGSTQEVYQSYRKGGGFEAVKRCVALVEEAKAKRGARLPYTNLRVVVTRDNQENLSALEKLAGKLGVNVFSSKTLGCLVNSDKFENYEPTREEFRRFEYDGSMRRSKKPIQCIFPFRQPLMFWDGTVVGCEYDYDLEAPLGKVGEQYFVNIWNSNNAKQLRRSIFEGKGHPEFCNRCPFKDSVRDGNVISYKEV